jgi:drug/metabolite transporter (DMT)-like permease
MTRTRANALLLFAGAIWGMGFVAQSTAMDHIGPLTFVAVRFAIATLVLIPFAYVETQSKVRNETDAPVDLRVLGRFALIGVAMFAGMATQQVGLLTTTVSNSGFLTGLYVVFTPLVAVLLFRDHVHPVVWPGASLALLGIFLLSGGDLAALVIGDLLTMVGAVCWAVQAVLIARHVNASGRPLLLAATQFATVCVLAVVGVVIAGERSSVDALMQAAPQLLYTGIIAGALAFTLQIVGQRYTSASQAVIFLSSEAPFAALFGALVLGERLGILGVFGCAAILASMLLVELVPGLKDRRRSREAPG